MHISTERERERKREKERERERKKETSKMIARIMLKHISVMSKPE